MHRAAFPPARSFRYSLETPVCKESSQRPHRRCRSLALPNDRIETEHPPSSKISHLNLPRHHPLSPNPRPPNLAHQLSSRLMATKKQLAANRLNGRGRDVSYPAPPAQIRTCGIPAYGSYLG